MESKEHKLAHKEEVNCGPLLQVMAVGTPNRCTQPWRRATAQSAAVVETSGIAFGQRVVDICIKIHRCILIHVL